MANHEKDDDYCMTQMNNLASVILSDLSTYQDHKENMANGGFLFQVVLLSGFIAKHDDALDALQSTMLVLLAFSTLWFIVHLYVRWQLRSKKQAALVQNGVLISMAQWIHKRPSSVDCKRCVKRSRMSRKYRWYDRIDRFFPMPNPNAPDFSELHYPKALVDGIETMYRLKPRAPLSDYIYFLGSMAILAIGIVFLR